MELDGYSIRERLSVGRHLLLRATRTADGRPVVLKVPTDALDSGRAAARLRTELEIAGRLPPFAVVRPLDLLPHGESGVLVFEDLDARSLGALVGRPLALTELLPLAIGLAEGLAAIHEAGVLHRDIKPENAVVLPDGSVRWTDFGNAIRATSSPGGGAGIGTLAYAAPEHTGRMNRQVDARSDLYGLGVTLYELAAGERPFRSEDPLELLHAHIAREPASLAVRRPDLPAVLPAIVHLLLRKAAEQRYQSAAGLAADLRRLARQGPEPFPLGAEDRAVGLLPPQGLRGRDAELDALGIAWRDALGGGAVLKTVSGDPGLGKSALVRELGPRVVAARGSVVAVDNDGGAAEGPWAALGRALGVALTQLLTGNEASLRPRRERIREALGPAARVLAEGTPALELVLGALPEVPLLPPADADLRFRGALLRLLQALPDSEHPLLVSIDDAHRADPALLRLLHDLLGAAGTRHLLVVLTWRGDAEGLGPDRSHALLGPHAVPASHLELRALSLPTVRDWLADALQDPGVAGLAAVVHRKTGGNPFFLWQFVERLAEDGLLTQSGAEWRWDLAAVEAREATDNVAELLRGELDRLPASTCDALAGAACLGVQFDLEGVARAVGGSRHATASDLAPAVARGALLLLDPSYAYEGPAPEGALRYRFAHERVRAAAYARVPEAERAPRHLAIARALQANGPLSGDQLLEVAAHLQRGAACIALPTERIAGAELLARAARRALGGAAAELARTLADDGLRLLGPAPFDTAPGPARALTLARAEAAFLTADLPAMDAATTELLRQQGDRQERVDALELRLHAFSHVGRHDDAIAACVAALLLLGHPVPARPSLARGGAALVLTSLRLRSVRPEDLAALPPTRDPDVQRAARLMLMVGASAQARAPGLFALILARSVGMGIRFGLSPEAPLTYLSYGFALSVVLGQRERGYRFGQEAVRLLGPPDRSPLSGQIITVFNTYVRHWREPRRQILNDYAVAARAALHHGSMDYYGYNLAAWALSAPLGDLALPVVQRTALDQHREIVRCGQAKMHVVMGALRQELRRLTGIADAGPDPAAALDGTTAAAWLADGGDDYVRFLLSSHRAFYAALRGEMDEALTQTRAARALDGRVFGVHQLSGVQWRMVGAVAAADRARREPREARTLRRWAAGPRRALAKAAAEAPFNYLCMATLAEAAWAETDGRLEQALRGCQDAVDAAREERSLALEVLATGRAASAHARTGLHSTARSWRQAQRSALQRWGAEGAVARLDEADPTLSTLGLGSSTATTLVGTISAGTGGTDEALDLASLLKAGQAISGELRLDGLLARLLSVAEENAGATRAAIVLASDAGEVVAARSDAEGPEPEALEGNTALPVGVIRFALRTGRDVLLGEPTLAALFAADPWVRERQPQSVLVVPLLHQGRTIAALYLENRLTSGAFTAGRLQLLRSLAGQAAIAVENARLYETQLARATAQARFVPHQFLRSLDRPDIVDVRIGDHVARDMAILFSDLRGFTGLSERLGPERTLATLNRYLAAMEPSIGEAGGFVDKYIGDAILALFEQGPDAALRAAIGMSRALRESNAATVDGEHLSMGIGVNAGPLTLGTIGARDRLSCTVIRDSVNLAARIEGLTRTYGSAVLISEHARERLIDPRRFRLRLVGRVAVKGRVEPVSLFEALDAEPDAVQRLREETGAAFSDAVDAFFGQRFTEAERAFAEVLALEPDDAVARRFRGRALDLAARPPGADWTGVEHYATK